MPKVRIESAASLSSTVKLYKLRVSASRFDFLPGQFLSFVISTEAGQAVRAYSFCSLPENLPKFELCVRQVPGGVGTNFLQTNLGRVVMASEAQGSFVLPANPSKILFLAAGVGIAPVRPMLKNLFAKFPQASATLIYKFRAGEYLFRDEFETLANQFPNFHLFPSAEARDLYARTVLANVPSDKAAAFVVGPPGFVGESIQLLEKIGYNKPDINFDIW